MKNLFTLVLMMFLSANVFSQTNKVTVKGTISDINDVGLLGVKIDVFQDGKLTQTLATSSDGKYKVDSLSLEHVYQFHFSKEGYCFKIAELTVKSTADKKMEGIFPMEISTSLFTVTKKQAKKLKFLKTEPIAKAKYNTDIDNIEWDVTYIEMMKAKVEAVNKK